jgi:hypothetical protein
MICHGRVVTEYRRHSGSLTGDPVRTLRGELRVLSGQRSTVQSRRERAALRLGRHQARLQHCDALRRRLCAQVQRRDWRGAARSASALLRNRPGALAGAVGDIWVVGVTAFRSRRRRGDGRDGQA